MNDSINARELLKLLQLGKTVTVSVTNPTEYATLRSRLATLKSEEDKIVLGLGLIDESATLRSECRPIPGPDAINPTVSYDCIFRLVDKAPPKTYSIVSVD